MKFLEVERIYNYAELANAVVICACDDYRKYHRQINKKMHILAYIQQRLDATEKNTLAYHTVNIEKQDIETDIHRLKCKIDTLEKFLLSDWGMMLSSEKGGVILEKLKKEQKTIKPSAKIGKKLYDKIPKDKGKNVMRGKQEMSKKCVCDKCEEVVEISDTYDGLCYKCLRNTYDLETFRQYCEASNRLDEFVMRYFLNCDEVPKCTSFDFHQLMLSVYDIFVREAMNKENPHHKDAKSDFIERIQKFIEEDHGKIGTYDYIEWLRTEKRI